MENVAGWVYRSERHPAEPGFERLVPYYLWGNRALGNAGLVPYILTTLKPGKQGRRSYLDLGSVSPMMMVKAGGPKWRIFH